jgi:hypothetical protein
MKKVIGTGYSDWVITQTKLINGSSMDFFPKKYK